MFSSKLQEWFPWTEWPVLCNGPMIGAACPALAAAVAKAGGIGFLASVFDLSETSDQLRTLDAQLTESRALLDGPGVGISFITAHASIALFRTAALPLIVKHAPPAVWLFAPEGGACSHAEVISALRTLARPPRVFVQVGNVAAAREALADGVDVLVCQGVDAGGHQFRRGSGVVSLVLEVRALVEREPPGREVALVAAGGVVEGKGVAAMMALEADGVVMGTWFTVAHESVYPDFRKQLVLQTVDGGISTLKSPFNDQIKNSPLWGSLYDGRAIIGPLHEVFLRGSTLEECQKMLEEYPPEEAARLIGTWAGAGVGLVERAQPAGEIVREVREEARRQIDKLARCKATAV